MSDSVDITIVGQANLRRQTLDGGLTGGRSAARAGTTLTRHTEKTNNQGAP
jgi:hypothetical protein